MNPSIFYASCIIISIMDDADNYLSPETLRDVLLHVQDLRIRKWADEDVKMLFRILYYSALRPGEGLKLKKSDLDCSRRQWRLGKTKTANHDYAAIPEMFIPDLKAWAESKPEGRLFPGLEYRTFYEWLRRLGKICNISAWTAAQKNTGEKTVGHIFRKSMAKEMYYGTFGKDAQLSNVIAGHLRHATPSTTFNSYLRLKLESVKNAL